MAIPAYNQQLDNMVSTAIDTYSSDPINALTDSGEKFLKAAAQMGRIFVVNDSENVRHPIMYDAGENTSLYTPDTLSGTPDGANNLSAAATEILTQAIFSLPAATKNINFPQSQPPGNMIDYVSSVVRANMMQLLNHEEILFVRGANGGAVASFQRRDAMAQDTSFAAGFPVSLQGLLYSGCTVSPDATGDVTDESFANIKVDDVPKWEPTHVAAAATDHSTLFSDLQSAILEASYSEMERPTHVYMALASFEKMLSLLRASAALPDPVQTNMGKEGTISFGGVTVDWSRYLAAHAAWDVVDPEATTASYPIVGINWNSLRLNTVRAGGVSGDSVGFIRQIGAMQTHPLLTNLFKRIEWKRQWSVDNGRRSFFTIYGNTTIA
jgi:hypothetical protein